VLSQKVGVVVFIVDSRYVVAYIRELCHILKESQALVFDCKYIALLSPGHLSLNVIIVCSFRWCSLP